MQDHDFSILDCLIPEKPAQNFKGDDDDEDDKKGGGGGIGGLVSSLAPLAETAATVLLSNDGNSFSAEMPDQAAHNATVKANTISGKANMENTWKMHGKAIKAHDTAGQLHRMIERNPQTPPEMKKYHDNQASYHSRMSVDHWHAAQKLGKPTVFAA